jgi:hypothetical protein
MEKQDLALPARLKPPRWICWALIFTVNVSAYANIITVVNTNDNGPGSLRQALVDANDGDTIDFDPSVNGQTITLTSAELVINRSVMISGPGAQFLTISISGIQLTRIFHVMPGQSATIDGLKIGETLPGDCTGGILNDHANLTVSNCTVEQNCAGQNGGGIDNDGGGGTATLTVVNSTVSFNRLVPYGQGGGIRNNNGSLMVISSDITGNTATSKGEPDGSIGGGIYSAGGTLEITNSTISGNHVNVGGGGLYGSGTITNSVITGNTATPFKASAGMGGGVWTQGVLTLSGCTVSNNIAEAGGGGILNFGTLTVTSCTISDNMAQGKHTLSPQGGGIDNYSDAASLEISNSTITNNVAGGGGGGIYNRNGNSTITYSTLSGNNGVNGGAIHNGATLEIKNNILNVGDFGPNIFNDGGTITSDGYNLSSDDGGGYLNGLGDQINTNPMLGPLQDNGGPTLTHALLPGSPAIDTGDPNFTPPPDYDQRGPGFDRVVNGRIDIGSFEVQATSPTPTPTATSTPGVTPTPRVSPIPRPRPSPAPRP